MEGYFAVNPKTSNTKKTLIAVLGLFAVVGVVATIAVASQSSSPALAQFQLEEVEFQEFMSRHSKSYASEEEYRLRFNIFRDNSAYIRVFNSLGNTWTLGVNEFTDMTNAEFRSIYTPIKLPARDQSNVEILSEYGVPSTVDWRTKGAVTPVKNQGQCGSCWSFSTTGCTEGAWFLAGHTLTSLSEQELMDCSVLYGNHGCNGGLMDNAFKYIIAKGITTEANYPYTAKDGLCNKSKAAQVASTLSKYTDVATDNVAQLQAAVAMQPISVAVEADQDAWQMYKGGVVTKNCGTALDHGVLIVGYNTTVTPNYWIVKNSWGATWGEAGYIRIAIVSGNGLCGIQMQPSYGTV